MRNVAEYGHIDGARFVVLIQCETEIRSAGLFGGDSVERREGVDEMLGVFTARVILYSEVINNQTGDNRTGSMGEETRSLFCLYATVPGKDRTRFCGKNFDGDSYVFVMVHGSVDVDRLEILLVDGTLFKRHLAVVMSAVGALASPGYWMKLPAAVQQIRMVSAFSSRTEAATRV